MRKGTIYLFFAGLLVLLFLGCSSAPPCTVSPIQIEETREDAKNLDKNLLAIKEKAKKLEQKLAKKKSEYEKKKDVPDELRKKAEELKKGSGRS